ncbi:MAG: DUF5666 domain-containing protein [Gammaproteobacteria bacterium]|nr:DUF5666 domain-containing protein [Gammaproteobacteria bacterium]MDH5304591.1 DUF5666 domain-containing protein [Gammaproteobacteria bacterium]
MNTKTIGLRRTFAACFGLLFACSGGDISFEISGPGITPNLPPWSDEPISAHGVNTGYAAVVVNGVNYGYSHAIVTVNGRAGTVSELRRGQVLIVRGQTVSGNFSATADRIDYDARVIGPVESIGASGNRINVMGLTVITDPGTVFAAGIDPANLTGLAVGAIAEISGYSRADGTILATRIDRAAGITDMQLIGEAADVDLANLRFKVNGLTVDYSAAVMIDLPGGAPSNGMTLKMVGDVADGRFVAEQLADVPRLAVSPGRRVQTEGLITRLDSAREFYVNHDAIVTDAGTVYRNGGQGDLVLNARLVIDGRATSGGRIAADRISFE